MAPLPSGTAPSTTNTDNSTNSHFEDERASSDGAPIPPLDHSDSQAHEDHSTTSFKSSTVNTNQNSSEESSSLAKAETRAVNRTKLLVLAVLFLAASAVGVATYLYARNTEQEEFEVKVSHPLSRAGHVGHVCDVMS